MSELRKPFLKESDKKTKKTENQSQNAARENNKPLARTRIFVQTPFSHFT